MKKILLFLLFSPFWASGQNTGDMLRRLDWGVGFETRFDNREYKSEYAGSGTLFGYKVAPWAAVDFGGRHRLAALLDFTHHYGAHGPGQQPGEEFMMWYGYVGDKLSVEAGVFPRRHYYGPEFVERSRQFYDRAIEGVGLTWNDRKGLRLHVEGDWYSMKGTTRRERFAIYSEGMYDLVRGTPCRVGVGYAGMMHHVAGSETVAGVVDNILFRPHVRLLHGGDRSYWSVDAGWLQAFQRDRHNENEFLTPGGFWGRARVCWRSVAVDNTIYLGDDLMPLWSRYGVELYLGDPFFRASRGIYDRLDLAWSPRIGKHIEMSIHSVHHYDGRTWNWQQMVTLGVRLSKNNISK